MSSSTAANAASAPSPAAAAQPPASNKDWLETVATQLEAEAGNLPAGMQSVKAALASSAQQLRTPEAAAVAKEIEIKKQVQTIKEEYGNFIEEEQKLKDASSVANAEYQRHKKERDRVDLITKGDSHVKLIGYNFEEVTFESMEHTSVYSEEEKQLQATRLDTLNAKTAQLEERAKAAKKALNAFRKSEEFVEAKDAYDEAKKFGPAAKAELAIKVGTAALQQRALNTRQNKLEAKQEAFLKDSKLENAEKNVSALSEQNFALNAKVSKLESELADLKTRHQELVQSNQASVGGGDAALQSKVDELEAEKKNCFRALQKSETKNKKLTIENTLAFEFLAALPDGTAHTKELNATIEIAINDSEKGQQILDRASKAVSSKKRQAASSAAAGGATSGPRKRPAPAPRPTASA